MATRSYIGILNKDGTITYVYAHWDGYPSCRAPILLNYYNTEDKIRELFSHGDISSLEDTIENTRFSKTKSQIISYNDFCEAYGVDYLYLFKNDKWYFCCCYHNDNFHSLEDWKSFETKD